MHQLDVQSSLPQVARWHNVFCMQAQHVDGLSAVHTPSLSALPCQETHMQASQLAKVDGVFSGESTAGSQL